MMVKKIKKLFSSFFMTILLLVCYAMLLAIATVIEKYYGTEVAKKIIYYSPVLFLVQFFLVVNFIGVLIKHQYLKKRKWGLVLTHLSFIVILFGALATHVWGEEGILHLREKDMSDKILVRQSDGNEIHTLPFSVELEQFTLTRYPGSRSPSSYESEVVIHLDGTQTHARIYMNNVLDIKGYRFFQSSYDSDERGTVLSVSHDPIGRSITYIGYFLLAIGLFLCFITKNSRFRTLSRKLQTLHLLTPIIFSGLILFAPSAANATNSKDCNAFIQKHHIQAGHAARFGALPMQSHKGRMMPVSTFSSEVLRKLHKSDRIGQLNADQFLLSLLVMPALWSEVSFISISNPELSSYYNIGEKFCSYAQLFDANHNYKLQEKLEEAYNKPLPERTRFDKDLMKLDEQINIFHQLVNRQMLALYPKEDDRQQKWYASGDDLSGFSGKDSMFVSRIMDWYIDEVRQALKTNNWEKANEVLEMISTYQQVKGKAAHIDMKKVQAELRYNNLNVFRTCKVGYLISGSLMLLFSFGLLFKTNKVLRWINLLCGLIVVFIWGYHTFGIGLRWYIGGYAPWSNSYETMVYVAWATVLAGLLFIRRSTITFALSALFGGVILFVSGLNWMDPEINPLVPVLQSPWLMFHVAVIVAAYGFFGISCLIGMTNLTLLGISFKRSTLSRLTTRIKELSIINEMSLWIGLALMVVGTFLGAVWANESWGRYWGWDPKETWALITIVVYAIVTHLRLMPSCQSVWLFNLLSILAFSSVLMTYFGVNYLLSGMHSYGQNDSINNLSVYLLLVFLVILMLSIFSYKGYLRTKK